MMDMVVSGTCHSNSKWFVFQIFNISPILLFWPLNVALRSCFKIPAATIKILPYKLKPEFSSGGEDNKEVFSESEEAENDSLAHLSNESHLVETCCCSCKCCVVMQKEIECIWCKELLFL